MTKPTPTAPAQPTEHVGPCQAQPSCRRACSGFAHERTIDGWATCWCGHTKGIHQAVTIKLP